MMESKTNLPIIWKDKTISKTYKFTFEHNPDILKKSKIYVRPQLVGTSKCKNILLVTEDNPSENIEISIVHHYDFKITPPTTQEM